jgi:methylated-DNA-[protein]-cysteine S-methyltransferase
MAKLYIDFYESPVGILEMWATETALHKLHIVDADYLAALSASEITKVNSEPEQEPPIIQQLHTQLDEYFAGKRQSFDIPLSPRGTDFQQQVWTALQTIPYGTTISYAQLATTINRPKACRAVGSANGRNPIAIIIPCHRVIASGGGLGGYAYGLEIKEQLLQIESQS